MCEKTTFLLYLSTVAQSGKSTTPFMTPFTLDFITASDPIHVPLLGELTGADIATGAAGNVRAALTDLEMWMG